MVAKVGQESVERARVDPLCEGGLSLDSASLDQLSYSLTGDAHSIGCHVAFDSPISNGKIISTEIVTRDLTSGDTGDYVIDVPSGLGVNPDFIRSWISEWTGCTARGGWLREACSEPIWMMQDATRKGDFSKVSVEFSNLR